MKDTALSENEWRIIKELLTSLEPTKIATKKMQYEQLLMGDFYAVWIQCKLSLRKLENTFCHTLTRRNTKARAGNY